MAGEAGGGYFVVIEPNGKRYPSPYWTRFASEEDFEAYLAEPGNDFFVWARGLNAQEAQDACANISTISGVQKTIIADNLPLVYASIRNGNGLNLYVIEAGVAALELLSEAQRKARFRRTT